MITLLTAVPGLRGGSWAYCDVCLRAVRLGSALGLVLPLVFAGGVRPG